MTTGREVVQDRRGQRRWVPAVAGWLTFLVGLLDVIGALLPEWHRRMRPRRRVRPRRGEQRRAPTATLVVGVLLLLLAHALRRRKRRAWRARRGTAAVSAALAHRPPASRSRRAWSRWRCSPRCSCYRDEFYAPGDPRTRWRALGVVVVPAAAFSVGLGLLIVSAHPGGLDGQLRLHRPAAARAATGCSASTDRSRSLATAPTTWSRYSLGALGLLTASSTVYLFAAARRARRRADRRGRGAAARAARPARRAATRSATSRCAATRAWSSRRAARPPSPTAWSPA